MHKSQWLAGLPKLPRSHSRRSLEDDLPTLSQVGKVTFGRGFRAVELRDDFADT